MSSTRSTASCTTSSAASTQRGSRARDETAAGDPQAARRRVMSMNLRERACRANLELAAHAASSSARSATCRSSIATPACSRSSRAACRTRELTPDKIVLVSLETGDGRRQHAAAVVRHADAPRAVSRLQLRRDRPHAFGVRDDVRAGADADPLHGDDARGLFSRRRAGDARR